jgi:SAM-dependent methyltransferase
MKTLSGNQDLVASYDRAAERYAEMFSDELDRKPFDRALLDRFADDVRDRGRVCDLGCGPGHISRYLKARGVDIFGIDLSSRMVEVASSLNPDLTFRQGDMLALDLPDHTLSGAVAFYSLIHLSRKSVPRALKEILRVLRPYGCLLLSVHGGEGEIHTDEFLGLPVSMDATLFQPDEVAGYVQQAGFSVGNIATRQPYDFEFQSTRIYVSAMKK